MEPCTQTEKKQSRNPTATLRRQEKQIHCAIFLTILLVIHWCNHVICEQESLTSKNKTHWFTVRSESQGLFQSRPPYPPPTNQEMTDTSLTSNKTDTIFTLAIIKSLGSISISPWFSRVYQFLSHTALNNNSPSNFPISILFPSYPTSYVPFHYTSVPRTSSVILFEEEDTGFSFRKLIARKG